jgi:hypothetical protein
MCSIFVYSSCAGAQDTTPTPPTKPSTSATLDITDLKIQMAESSLKVNPTLRGVAELASALESYLTKNCFGNLLQTLQYDGPLTDSDCIVRLDRLFQVYPDNPVGVCLRDGLGAKSCRDAYRNQSLKKFSGGSDLKSIPDPALKVGLSAADTTKINALSETLRNVNAEYQGATTDEEKQKLEQQLVLLEVDEDFLHMNTAVYYHLEHFLPKLLLKNPY